MRYDEAVSHLRNGGVICVAKHPYRLRRLKNGVVETRNSHDCQDWVSTGQSIGWLEKGNGYYGYYSLSESREKTSEQNFAPAYLEAIDEIKAEVPASQLFTAEEAVKLTAKVKAEKIDQEFTKILAEIKDGIQTKLISNLPYHGLDQGQDVDVVGQLVERLRNLNYQVMHYGTSIRISW